MKEVSRRELPRTIGPFDIVQRLGAGGMAETFEGVRRGRAGFAQRVCVKRILPGQAHDPELEKLFFREARLAAALSHRNIVRVVELGEDPSGPYLALELVDGMDLRKLTVGTRLPLGVVALIGCEIAEALEHAHTRADIGPILHRDVTAANILVSADGDVKLADFGIARAAKEAPLSNASLVRGNLWYLAPEVLDGTSRGDPRSDLYSLGIVLYQCLAGRRPYAGAGVSALRALHEGKRTPLAEAAPGTPRAMCKVIDRLLSEKRTARFPSAAALAEALAPFVPPNARRTLKELVQKRRSAKPRATVRVEPMTADVSVVELPQSGTIDLPVEERAPRFCDLPTQPARPSIDPPRLPARWQQYAIGPRVWAAPDAAALERARKRRGLAIAGATLALAAIASAWTFVL